MNNFDMNSIEQIAFKKSKQKKLFSVLKANK